MCNQVLPLPDGLLRHRHKKQLKRFREKRVGMTANQPENNDKKVEVGIGKALPGKLEELAAEMNISTNRSCEILLEDLLGVVGHSARPEKK